MARKPYIQTSATYGLLSLRYFKFQILTNWFRKHNYFKFKQLKTMKQLKTNQYGMKGFAG